MEEEQLMMRGFWDETAILWSCCVLFLAIYALGYAFLFRGWKRKLRLEAASCGMSMAHSTIVTLLSGYCIWSISLSSSSSSGSFWPLLGASNTSFQDNLMEFSVAYFLIDLLHYLVFAPDEYHFVLHHLATTTYMLSCRYYTRHGGMSVMALMCLAEMTAPLQNVWTVSKFAISSDNPKNSTLARRIHDSISPLFIPFFTVTRGILGPWLLWKTSTFYLSGMADTVIPRWLAAYWMMTVTIAILGSVLWVSQLWLDLLRNFADKNTKAASKIPKLE